MILPQSSDDDDDGEIDWDAEESRINDMSWNEVDGYIRRNGRIRTRIMEAYSEWLDAKVAEQWGMDDREEIIKQYCIDHDLLTDLDGLDGDERAAAEAANEDALNDSDNVRAAREAWQDQARDDAADQYSIDDWIEDEYRTMSRFVSEFDIVIEPDDYSYRSSSQSGDSVREEAAESLRDVVDESVRTGGGGGSTVWHVIDDGSLSGDGTGMELVSPVFSMTDGLNALKTVFEWMEHYRATTNSSTGLHVSFSIEGKSLSDYDYLKMIMLYDENYTASLFKRLSNTYAQQMRTRLFTNINAITEVDKLPERDIAAMIFQLRRLSPSVHAISEKYFSFRHRANGVFEFRTMGNAGYQRRYADIRKRIVAMAAIMKVGADPTLMAREYLSRIYKILTTEKFSSAALTRDTPQPPPTPFALSAFAGLLSRNKALATAAVTDPPEFLRLLIKLLKRGKPAALTPNQVRQLRVYAKRHKIAPAMVDTSEFPALTGYLGWPLAVSGDPRQQTLPFVRPTGSEVQAPDEDEEDPRLPRRYFTR
jgi:hypothetical protein